MVVLLDVIANLAAILNEVELDRKWVISVGVILLFWWGRPKKFAKAFSTFSSVAIVILVLLNDFIDSISKSDQDDDEDEDL